MSTQLMPSTTSDLDMDIGPFRTTPLGVHTTREPTFDEWEHFGAFLKTMSKRIPWAWGDWLNFAEGKPEWGDKYQQVISDTGLDYGTISNMKSVSKRCQFSFRNENLNWTHHQLVFAYDELSDHERKQFLEIADKERDGNGRPLSCAKLRTRIKEYIESKQMAEASAVADESEPEHWEVTPVQEIIECQAVITDPPYGILDEPWEPRGLEQFTREWATRWAKCGADTFAIFWSQDHLWDGRRWLDQCLVGYEFQQLLVWVYRNNKSCQSRKGFKQTWEPIYFYRRIGSDRQILIGEGDWGEDLHDMDTHVEGVPQSNFNEQNMKRHPAQKPVGVMRWLVNALTKKDELVCDPFCGSGTTGIACAQLGRRFHGIETDSEYLSLAKGRIATYGRE